jgi:hypothetical protein
VLDLIILIFDYGEGNTMEYKKEFFNDENIPDFALQPAKPASSFDPTVYDRLFENLKQPVEQAAPSGMSLEVGETEVADETVEVAELDEVDEAMEVAEAEKADGDEETDEAMEVAKVEKVEKLEEVKPTAKVLEIKPVSLPITDNEEVKTVAVVGDQSDRMTETLKYTVFEKSDFHPIKIEEDVLITDTKPDMKKMLHVGARCHLKEHSFTATSQDNQPIRLSGDLVIQALYSAEKEDGRGEIISFDTKIPLREEYKQKTSMGADVDLRADIISTDWVRINERKFRVSAEVGITAREYSSGEIEVFKGIKNEELQLLQDEFEFTDIAIRKSEVIEVSEEIPVPEGAANIENIMLYDIDIIESHKQIIGEKAMIGGTINIGILYESDDGPVFFNHQADITHFIRVNEQELEHPLIGGQVNFDVLECSISPKRDDDGYYNALSLDMEVGIDLEYYHQIQESYITDLYHLDKEVEFNKEQKDITCLLGGASMDLSVRETIEIPDHLGQVEKIIYASGKPQITKEEASFGKVGVEGTLPINMVLLGGTDGKDLINISKGLDFKAEMDVIGSKEGMETDCKVAIKSLKHERINNRQVSVSAKVAVFGFAFEKAKVELIKDVTICERPKSESPSPAIIICIAKKDDTVWKISKRYRTKEGRIRSLNDLAEHEKIEQGKKILVLC